MPRKRQIKSSTVKSPVKRRKLDDSIPSDSQSPSQNHLTPDGKAELTQWLDQADRTGNPIFTCDIPAGRKTAKDEAFITEKPLVLNEKTYLNARWAIKPAHRWTQMTKYKKFTVGNRTHSIGDCVLVKSGSGTEHDLDWKAQIHEVRAADEHHVYLRVTWLENPQELSAGVQAKSSDHGQFELIPSNKMDIVDALSVNGPLKVTHWDEASDDARMPEQGEYFWRRTYDYTTGVLSPLNTICKCKEPHNPDHLIIKCSNEACGTWLHAYCLAEDAIQRRHNQEQENGVEESIKVEPKVKPGTKIKAESKAKTGSKVRTEEQARKHVDGIYCAADGVSAENETTKAEVVAEESDTGAPEILLIDKLTSDESREAVRCLVCKQVVE